MPKQDEGVKAATKRTTVRAVAEECGIVGIDDGFLK
jgi:hypothetical protein